MQENRPFIEDVPNPEKAAEADAKLQKAIKITAAYNISRYKTLGNMMEDSHEHQGISDTPETGSKILPRRATKTPFPHGRAQYIESSDKRGHKAYLHKYSTNILFLTIYEVCSFA